jgi:hypothetical protein
LPEQFSITVINGDQGFGVVPCSDDVPVFMSTVAVGREEFHIAEGYDVFADGPAQKLIPDKEGVFPRKEFQDRTVLVIFPVKGIFELPYPEASITTLILSENPSNS